MVAAFTLFVTGPNIDPGLIRTFGPVTLATGLGQRTETIRAI